jgi:hypothetical protein
LWAAGALAAFARREWAIAAGIFCILVALVAVAKVNDLQYQRGDSAIFFQTLENVAHRGKAVSQVFANTQGFIDSHLSIATAQEIADNPLAPPAEKERNMLKFHAYYILYAMAPLAWIAPSNVVNLTLDAFCYLGMLLLAYILLRRKGLPFAAGGLFCLLIVAHPAWSQGLFYGQFYPDRLFVLAGFAFICAVHSEKRNRSLLAVCALLCALINERAALMAGLFAVLYTGVYWNRRNLDPYFKLALGVAMLAYGEFMLKFGLANAEYGSFLPTSLHGAIAEFHDPAFAQKSLMLAVVSLVFFAFAAFNVRGAIIAAALMAPNFLGNIGGAEKVGWASHYPSYYLPALVWAAMTGYEVAYSRLTRWGPAAFYAVALFAPLFVASIGTDSFYPIRISPANISDAFPVKLQRDLAFDMSPAGSQTRSMTASLRDAVPDGSVVTTVEEGMPLLYHGRTLRLFPVGVDRADYAVFYFARPRGAQPAYFGVVNFLGKQELDKINASIVNRMKRDGYDFKDAQYFPAQGVSGMVVVKRKS